MTARTAMAPKVPQKITLRWVFLGRLRATRPMIRALSPASTRSIRTIANSADTKPADKKSSSTGVSNKKERFERRSFRQRRIGTFSSARRSAGRRALMTVAAPTRRTPEARAEHGAGQQELQQMPVAHRQHGELAAEIEDGELQARLAEQRRIDGVAERSEDHADHHRGHEQLAADGRRPDGVVGAVRVADQQHDRVHYFSPCEADQG